MHSIYRWTQQQPCPTTFFGAIGNIQNKENKNRNKNEGKSTNQGDSQGMDWI